MKILKRLPPAVIRDAIELAKCLWANTHNEEFFAKYHIRSDSFGYNFSPNHQSSKIELVIQPPDSGAYYDPFSCTPYDGWGLSVPSHTQIVSLLALDFLKRLPTPPPYSDIHLSQSLLEGCVEMQGSEDDRAIAMEKVVATLGAAATFWLKDKWHCPVCPEDDFGCEMLANDRYRSWSIPRHGLLLEFMRETPESERTFMFANSPESATALADEWNRKYGVWLRGVSYWKDAFPNWALSDVDDEVVAEAIATGFSIETLRKLVSLTEEQISETVAFYNENIEPSKPSTDGEIILTPEQIAEAYADQGLGDFVPTDDEKYVSPFTRGSRFF